MLRQLRGNQLGHAAIITLSKGWQHSSAFASICQHCWWPCHALFCWWLVQNMERTALSTKPGKPKFPSQR